MVIAPEQARLVSAQTEKPPAPPAPAITPEQRLLILDSWRARTQKGVLADASRDTVGCTSNA